jgi:hypothetical protein
MDVICPSAGSRPAGAATALTVNPTGARATLLSAARAGLVNLNFRNITKLNSRFSVSLSESELEFESDILEAQLTVT